MFYYHSDIYRDLNWIETDETDPTTVIEDSIARSAMSTMQMYAAMTRLSSHLKSTATLNISDCDMIGGLNIIQSGIWSIPTT